MARRVMAPCYPGSAPAAPEGARVRPCPRLRGGAELDVREEWNGTRTGSARSRFELLHTPGASRRITSALRALGLVSPVTPLPGSRHSGATGPHGAERRPGPAPEPRASRDRGARETSAAERRRLATPSPRRDFTLSQPNHGFQSPSGDPAPSVHRGPDERSEEACAPQWAFRFCTRGAGRLVPSPRRGRRGPRPG